MNANPLLHCLCCNNEVLIPYLDLGFQPLANSYLKGDEHEPTFPLAVQVCPTCFHSQLTVAVDPDLLYKHYLYVSGTSRTLHAYFEWFVVEVEKRHIKKRLNVLEIASNDGTLLEIFKQQGHVVQGVDPAENLRDFSLKKEVPTVVGYWNQLTAGKINDSYDVIVAMNVLAHISDPVEFLQLCRKKLTQDGKIYIQTSQCEMFKHYEFDTIYHEHHSFFTTRSFHALAKRSGLKLLDIEKVPIHGISYLATFGHPFVEESEHVDAFLQEEGLDGYYDLRTYDTFGRHVKESSDFIRMSLDSLRKSGYKAIGYGAAAKGNTFLNYAGIQLDYVIDENSLKWGLFTPGQKIPIVSAEILKEIQKPLAVLVLAWNFFDEIHEKVKALRPHAQDVFLQYFPERKLSD